MPDTPKKRDSDASAAEAPARNKTAGKQAVGTPENLTSAGEGTGKQRPRKSRGKQAAQPVATGGKLTGKGHGGGSADGASSERVAQGSARGARPTQETGVDRLQPAATTPTKPSSVKKRIFPSLSYKSFTYPQDEEALEAVKRIPGVPKLFNWIIDNFLEEYLALDHLYNTTRVDRQQYPSLFDTVRKCCKILDCPVPEVYVSFNIGFNAVTSGVDRTFVMIGSRVVDIFPPDDLLFIIGHELGHIKANHVLYKTVMRFVVEFLPVLQSMIPFNIGMLTRPMLLALAEWDRRSEFTSDRAGLLCCQNLEASTSALAWFSGRLRRRENEYKRDVLADQVQDVKLTANKLARLMLFLNSMQNTHPYAVLRVAELRTWHASGVYDEILKGNYIRDVAGVHEAGKRRQCPGCGELTNVKLDFCPKCGTHMRQRPAAAQSAERACGKCGAPLNQDARFCVSCGAAVPEASSGQSVAPR